MTGQPSPADWHRQAAATFTERVEAVTDWAAPTPVKEWVARDIVDHLTTWLPDFLESGSGLRLPAGPAAADDPVGAWRAQRDAVQELLDDPQRSAMPYRSDALGELTVEQVLTQFYTADVFMHTWDLARATGQDDRLDEQTCAGMLEGMSQMEDMLRASGQFGTRQPVADDAPVRDRFIAFIGRDPHWQPPA